MLKSRHGFQVINSYKAELFRISPFLASLFFSLKNGWSFSRNSTDIWCRWWVSVHSLKYHSVILICFLVNESKEKNLYLPCWFSKTLAQKPAASPVHSKILSEAEKMLAILRRERILGGYYINLCLILNRIGINEIAAVETNVCKICLGQFMRQMTPKWQGVQRDQRHANILNIEETKWCLIRTNSVPVNCFALTRQLIYLAYLWY